MQRTEDARSTSSRYLSRSSAHRRSVSLNVSKYLQIESIDFTPLDRSLHLSSSLRLGVLHRHLLVKIHNQSKRPLFLGIHFTTRLRSFIAFSNSRASSSLVTASPMRCSSCWIPFAVCQWVPETVEKGEQSSIGCRGVVARGVRQQESLESDRLSGLFHW